eukprot:14362165-Heterocapsa_arctica.AAC.1
MIPARWTQAPSLPSQSQRAASGLEPQRAGSGGGNGNGGGGRGSCRPAPTHRGISPEAGSRFVEDEAGRLCG